jgi:hypothetical protein
MTVTFRPVAVAGRDDWQRLLARGLARARGLRAQLWPAAKGNAAPRALCQRFAPRSNFMPCNAAP